MSHELVVSMADTVSDLSGHLIDVLHPRQPTNG